MASDDLYYLSVAEIGAMLRARQLSPVGLTRLMLHRIEAESPRLRPYARVTVDRAMEDASRAEQALAEGKATGPLHGIPIALKDLVDTAGIATEAGTRHFAGRIPAADATVAARLRAAGAILLGKLAMAEGAFADHRPERPAPVNPWNADAWTGVSSSGAGVAVAAGLAFGAIGSDTGGSIRFPCSACGVTGLKPGWGRVSRHGVIPMAPSLDHVGPIARSAADCALLFDAIAGRDPLDPTSIEGPEEVAAERQVRGLRIGIDRASLEGSVHPEVLAALEGALAALGEAGCSITAISLPDTRPFAAGWALTCGAEIAPLYRSALDSASADLGPALRGLVELGRTAPACDYARLHEARLVFTAQVDDLFGSVDLIACPVMPMPTPPATALAAAAASPEAVAALLRFTVPWNYSGHPSLTLPGGFDAEGLPLGFQLVGARLAERRLLAAGAAFQRLTDWHKRRPPARRSAGSENPPREEPAAALRIIPGG